MTTSDGEVKEKERFSFFLTDFSDSRRTQKMCAAFKEARAEATSAAERLDAGEAKALAPLAQESGRVAPFETMAERFLGVPGGLAFEMAEVLIVGQHLALNGPFQCAGRTNGQHGRRFGRRLSNHRSGDSWILPALCHAR